jgi:hypothetical protein
VRRCKYLLFLLKRLYGANKGLRNDIIIKGAVNMWINIENVRKYFCYECEEDTTHELYERTEYKEIWECNICACKDNEVER